MKLSDASAGLVLLGLGLAVVLHTATFPPMPGQSIGPAMFPMLAGSCLGLVGAFLFFSGLRHRTAPWIEPGEWVRRPRMLLNFLLVIADLVFYALVVNWLGFFLTGVLFLAVLFVAFKVNRRRIVPLAVVVTFSIHYAFYTLLRVPLPWGLLEGIAW